MFESVKDARRFSLEVTEGGIRIDVFLSKELGISRSRAKRILEDGFVLLSGSIPKPSKKVKEGDKVFGVIPPPDTYSLEPEDIPIDVIYEDDDVAVVDKPAGLVVHPSPGHRSGTMVNALMARFSRISEVGDSPIRPGIVHRLDADTSGLMVVAKSMRAYSFLQDAFKGRRVKKIYRAVVWGRVDAPGELNLPIGRHPVNRKKMCVRMDGREAITLYRPIASTDELSYLEVEIKTGRTHQIRVHMSHVGHPVVGDRFYGRKDGAERMYLHAHLLSFPHPDPEKGYLTFSRDVPLDFAMFLKERGLF